MENTQVFTGTMTGLKRSTYLYTTYMTLTWSSPPIGQNYSLLVDLYLSGTRNTTEYSLDFLWRDNIKRVWQVLGLMDTIRTLLPMDLRTVVLGRTGGR